MSGFVRRVSWDRKITVPVGCTIQYFTANYAYILVTVRTTDKISDNSAITYILQPVNCENTHISKHGKL